MTAHSAYDELPYEARPFPQTHPDRLATIAVLFGMRPAPTTSCRVLELGCASGGNLIPMAEQLPGSQFLGIDLSSRQIADGQAIIGALGLRNVTLRQEDLLAFDAAGATFDYVMCHGVYSWVPAAVQEKILDICARHLAPQGVAFISYNTYPGWAPRRALREMMIYHARDRGVPADQVAQGRALAEFLAHAAGTGGNVYGRMLQEEVRRLQTYTDSQMFHEYLEEENQPVYFHDFAARAQRYGLQYLGDAEASTMFTRNFPKPVAETLDRLGTDVIRAEQYVDFVLGRAFRQTLLCRGDVTLQRVLSPERVVGLHVASAARPRPNTGAAPTTFEVPEGPTFTPSHPFVAAAFHHLAQTWRQSVSFDDLCAIASRKAPSATGCDLLAADVLVGYTAKALELRTAPADFVRVATAKPAASALARYQAQRAQTVTNRRHEAVILDDLALRVLSLLDGERDRAALVETLVGMASTGAMRVEHSGQVLLDPAALRTVLTPALDLALATLAQSALLVA